MKQKHTQSGPAASGRERGIQETGFSILELAVVLGVSLIMAAIAVPTISSSLSYFKLRSAVTAATSAIQSTRYRAIYDGCAYQLTLSKATNEYQIASETSGTNTCAAAFTSVGGAVPFTSSQIALNQDVTLQFQPSGIVQSTAGAMTFTLADGTRLETITVTRYGAISVKP